MGEVGGWNCQRRLHGDKLALNLKDEYRFNINIGDRYMGRKKNLMKSLALRPDKLYDSTEVRRV